MNQVLTKKKFQKLFETPELLDIPGRIIDYSFIFTDLCVYPAFKAKVAYQIDHYLVEGDSVIPRL